MNAAALESAPPIRPWNACRPRAAGAHIASRSPRLLRCQDVPPTRRCPWLRAAWACGPALLATDSLQRPSVVGRPFQRQSVVAYAPCPHSFLFPDSNPAHRSLREILALSSTHLVHQLPSRVTPSCYLWSNDSGLSVIDLAWE